MRHFVGQTEKIWPHTTPTTLPPLRNATANNVVKKYRYSIQNYTTTYVGKLLYPTTRIHVWHDGTQNRVRRYSSLPRVSVQAFEIKILQLILGFHLPCLTVLLEHDSSMYCFSRICWQYLSYSRVTSNNIHFMSQLGWVLSVKIDAGKWLATIVK
jgi:hypothetical protein